MIELTSFQPPKFTDEEKFFVEWNEQKFIYVVKDKEFQYLKDWNTKEELSVDEYSELLNELHSLYQSKQLYNLTKTYKS